MKHLCNALLLLCLSVQYSKAQEYSQYFDIPDSLVFNYIKIDLDTSSSNIWQIGAPHKIIFDSAATLPNGIVTDTIHYYPINNHSSFTVKVHNPFFNWGIFALQWKQKIDFDPGHDGAIVEYSGDSGQSWQNVLNNPFVYNFYGYLPENVDTLDNGVFALSGTDSTWKDLWLCFEVPWMNGLPDTLMLRFSIHTDSIDQGKEGWLIDNFNAHLTFIHTTKEADTEEHFNVYPNPSNGRVTVETAKLMSYHLIERMELINVQGQLVEHWDRLPSRFWFDTDKYPEGHYFLKVQTNIKTETIPLVISKH